MRHNPQLAAYQKIIQQITEPPMQTIYSYDPATCNQIHSLQSVHLNQTENYLIERTALNPNTVFISKPDGSPIFYIWKGVITKQLARQVKNWKPIRYVHLNPQLKAYMLITQE